MEINLLNFAMFALGGVVCLAGWWLYSRSSGSSSKQFQGSLEGLSSLVQDLQEKMEGLKAWQRNLESEWDATHQRLRGMLGRLDKHAARERKNGEGKEEASEEVEPERISPAALFCRKNR